MGRAAVSPGRARTVRWMGLVLCVVTLILCAGPRWVPVKLAFPPWLVFLGVAVPTAGLWYRGRLDDLTDDRWIAAWVAAAVCALIVVAFLFSWYREVRLCDSDRQQSLRLVNGSLRLFGIVPGQLGILDGPAGWTIRAPTTDRVRFAVWLESGILSQRFRYLAIPLWLVLLAAGGPTVLLWRRCRRALRGHCEKCHYNLTGADHKQCPECGTPVAKGGEARKVAAHPVRRRAASWSCMSLSFLFVLVAVGTFFRGVFWCSMDQRQLFVMGQGGIAFAWVQPGWGAEYTVPVGWSSPPTFGSFEHGVWPHVRYLQVELRVILPFWVPIVALGVAAVLLRHRDLRTSVGRLGVEDSSLPAERHVAGDASAQQTSETDE